MKKKRLQKVMNQATLCVFVGLHQVGGVDRNVFSN